MDASVDLNLWHEGDREALLEFFELNCECFHAFGLVSHQELNNTRVPVWPLEVKTLKLSKSLCPVPVQSIQELVPVISTRRGRGFLHFR